jgi:hypothetical protein
VTQPIFHIALGPVLYSAAADNHNNILLKKSGNPWKSEMENPYA